MKANHKFLTLLLLLGAWIGASTAQAQSPVTVGAWGGNDYGQTTVPVAAQSGVTAIAAGGYHTVALKTGGSVVVWGANWAGQTNVPLAAQSGVTAIAAGYGHTVALKNNGTVVAWGLDYYGQVTGIPTSNSPSFVATASPVTLGGQVLSGVTAITAGTVHTVALKTGGSVVAWGDNAWGQTTVPLAAQSGVTAIAAGRCHTVALKNDGTVVAWGTYDGTNVPAGLSGVTAIAAGGAHTVALKNDGTVVAWGTYDGTNVPAGLSGVTAIAAGGAHTVALKNDGSVVVWGAAPTVPAGLSAVTAIAAGDGHTVVILIPTAPIITTPPASQTVNVGQNANFAVAALGFPVYYQWRKDEVDIAEATSDTYDLIPAQTNQAGSYTVVVSNPAGSVTSAPPAVLTVTREVPIITTPPASQTVNVGQNANFAVTALGFLVSYQWRKDGVDIAGATSDTYDLIPAQTNQAGSYTVVVSNPAGSVTSAPPAVLTVTQEVPIITSPPASQAVNVWQNVNFAVRATGDPLSYQWRKDGLDIAEATGDTYDLIPAQTNQAGSYTVVVSNPAGSVTSAPPAVLTVNATPVPGMVLTWGANWADQTTVPLVAQSGVTAIAVGNYHTVTLKNDGTVVAWGANNYGQVTGTPATADPYSATASPVTLEGQVLSGVTAIAAGPEHTVALKKDGSVVAWGKNSSGQVTGTPTTDFPYPATANPVTLEGQILNGVVAIAGGGYEGWGSYSHTVALKNDGSVVAWGANASGQTTVPVEAQSGVTAIAAGSAHTVALKHDGTVVAWGANGSGQVTGTPTPDLPYSVTASPVILEGQVLTGVTAIAAGGWYTVALKNDGTVVAWGANNYGQVTGTPATADPYSATASPVTLEGQVVSGVTAIGAGSEYTVALKNDGSVVAWGYNGQGQVTGTPAIDSPYSATASPVTLEGQVLSGVTAIAPGWIHTVALFGGVPLLPSLNVRLSGNQLILSWPTNAVGFTLQSRLDSTPPMTWIDSTNSPVVIGAQFTVTNTTSGCAQFYRLRKP